MSRQNDEARMTNEEGMTKARSVNCKIDYVVFHFVIWDLFRHYFDIRIIRDFVIRAHMCSITLSPNC